MASALVEEELKCPICMELLTGPVTLDCGHNFCRGCITNYCETWEDLGEDLECPLCKAKFKKVNFRPNFSLANIVEKIKLLQLNSGKWDLCVKHMERLHLFCKEDKELVCVFCKQSPEHRSHTILLLDEAAEEYKDLINTRLKNLRAEREKIWKCKADAEKESQDLLNQTEQKRQKIKAEFRQIHQFLEEEERSLLAQMEKDIRKTLQRSEKKEVSENPVAFPPELTCRIGEFRDVKPLLETIRKQFEAKVTLDPDTANLELILSEDCKSVRRGGEPQDLPNNPERFDVLPFVLGCEGFTAGRHFWEVTVGGEGDWAVGVARKSVRRKGLFLISPEEGIWAVGKWGGQYRVFNPPDYIPLSLSQELPEDPSDSGLCWGQVAFSDADTGVHLYTHSGASFCGKTLLPFFFVFDEVHLRLSP